MSLPSLVGGGSFQCQFYCATNGRRRLFATVCYVHVMKGINLRIRAGGVELMAFLSWCLGMCVRVCFGDRFLGLGREGFAGWFCGMVLRGCDFVLGACSCT